MPEHSTLRAPRCGRKMDPAGQAGLPGAILGVYQLFTYQHRIRHLHHHCLHIYIQSHRPSQCPPAGHQPLRRLRHHLRCGLFAPSPPPTIPPQFHLDILFGIGLGNMVFGLCRGAWAYKGPCTAGGKLAAGALRVLKRAPSTRARARRGWGTAPLSQDAVSA